MTLMQVFALFLFFFWTYLPHLTFMMILSASCAVLKDLGGVRGFWRWLFYVDNVVPWEGRVARKRRNDRGKGPEDREDWLGE